MENLNEPFQRLFDETSDSGLSLPSSLQEIYDGDWVVPDRDDRVYVYSNFVLSHDGRISFNEPGHFGGGDVAGGCPHDQWLMALLRSRADAVMVGDNTLFLEPEHVWSHQYIFPAEADRLHALRNEEGRSKYPLQVFLSLHGEINWDGEVFASPDLHVVIATTHEGAARVEQEKRGDAKVDVIIQDQSPLDLAELVGQMRDAHGIKTLLLEGGPRAYGSALADRIIDDEFLTLSPVTVGNDGSNDRVRPGLYEGIAFSPANAVRMMPVSLRRSGAYLFGRYRCSYPDG
ncbi:MAG: dihydrofolate reductase family protein [Woeseiaceae bacterium]|nr:dihydrofolate reductase family protein [Woeseiaceae bacterium]